MRNYRYLSFLSLVILIFVGLLLVPRIATAAVTVDGTTIDDTTSPDAFLTLFQSKAMSIQTTVLTYATWLFWVLFGLSFTWGMIQMALTDNLTLMSIIASMFKHLFYGAFFWVLILHPEWIHAIYQGFGSIGSVISKGDIITAQGITNLGLAIYYTVIALLNDTGGIQKVALAIILVIPCLIITMCFAIAAATVLVMQIEAYVVICVGIIMLGFGGALATRDMSISYLKYSVSYGIKLLVLNAVIFIMTEIIKDWVGFIHAGGFANLVTTVLQICATSVIFLMLIRTLPNTVSGIITGATIGQAGDLKAAAGSALGGLAIASGIPAYRAIQRELQRGKEPQRGGGGNNGSATNNAMQNGGNPNQSNYAPPPSLPS